MSIKVIATPLALTSLIVEVLKTFFSEPGKFVYVPGQPDVSTLAILEKNVNDPSQTQKRPALITSRGDVNCVRYSIGDVKSSYKDGTQTMSMLLQGSYTVMCVSTNSQEADVLAEEVLGCLMCLQTVISRDWDFLKFQAVNIGEVQTLEEYKDSFIVPVTFTYEIERAWGVLQVSPILKKINKIFNEVAIDNV